MNKLFFIVVLISLLFGENHLSNEISPYLIQHKNNPVDWYPWGKEALQKAKKENKYIFLSIGYSTCHWCHVMAKESFENQKVAQILNKYFISIKVDKEQYPHIDKYYQKIYRNFTNKSGGWPLTIILTADMKPIYAATYIPKDDGYGSVGLLHLLTQVVTTPKNIIAKFQPTVIQQSNKKQVPIDKKIVSKTISKYKNIFDFDNKGFAIRPKFPHPTNIKLLLKLYKITNSTEAKNMALSMLDTMARGGIYDQIEGGFFRYTTDKKWILPHFEKMLYTNAQLIDVYTQGYIMTHNPLYKKVVQETINNIDKRFAVDFVYQSGSNADSINFDGKNEEGFYFLFDYNSTKQYLLKHHISLDVVEKNLNYLGIVEDGNFDGEKSNPNITKSTPPKDFNKIKTLLYKLRLKRHYPFIDNKINTAWNGLYIDAKFKAGYISSKYIFQAQKSLDKLLSIVYKNGVLYHQTIYGKKAIQKGLLEDYAFVGRALFDGYEATLNPKYLKLFKKIVQQTVKLFYINNKWIDSNDQFITTSDIDENSYANPLAVTLQNMILYATLEANTELYDIVLKTLDNFAINLNTNPEYYPTALMTYLQTQYQPMFIKSNKTNLNKIHLESISYPFVYKYVTNTSEYLACKLNSCQLLNPKWYK